MTAPERTIEPGEDDRAQVHARIAVRQAVMKGMDREALADALMTEAVKLTFGVEDAEAARLAQRWKEETFRLLDADYVTRVGSEGRPKVVRLLRPVSRERLMATTAWVRAS
ncbi:MAG: hypothetical protein WDO17_17010 [Alphaproteobacteria bacterium]